MLEKFWKFIHEQDSLVGTARHRSVAMLKTTHEMFHSVIYAIKEGPGAGYRERVADIDKVINHEQREVRKMVLEHLALSATRDLPEGLRLIMVVIDIERIGDLSKNIEELFEMMPHSLNLGDADSPFGQIERCAFEVFDQTVQAFENNDEGSARAAISGYNQVARMCEEYFRKVLSDTSARECVPRSDLGLVLLLRYVKRTCGHLKNIASAVINPVDRIGYREGLA